MRPYSRSRPIIQQAVRASNPGWGDFGLATGKSTAHRAQRGESPPRSYAFLRWGENDYQIEIPLIDTLACTSMATGV